MGAYAKALGDFPTAQECRELIDSVLAQVINARTLRETASDLRQFNAEMRERLRENWLAALTMEERWMDVGRFPPAKE